MRKLLQTTSVFILGIGLLTGCSDGKVAKDVSTPNVGTVQNDVTTNEDGESAFDKIIDSQTVDEPVAATVSYITKTTVPTIATAKTQESVAAQNNNQSTASQNNQQSVTKQNNQQNSATQQAKKDKVAQQATQAATKAQAKTSSADMSKHNFTEAAKVMKPMEYGIINFNVGKNPINVFRYAASTDYKKDYSKPVTVPVSTIVDLVNTYNAETYNVNDILNKLKASGNSVVVLDRSIETYDEQSLDKLIPNMNTVVYFKVDGLFALKTATGYGGTSGVIFAPTSDWKVNGDEIRVPYETIGTKKPTGEMILHLNNKNYEFSKNKPMYYVEKFTFY